MAGEIEQGRWIYGHQTVVSRWIAINGGGFSWRAVEAPKVTVL